MPREEIVYSNFASGELSPKIRGRYLLPIHRNGCEYLYNFIAEIQGGARFRSGFRYVFHTRRNNLAFLYTFQFNDEQSYVLEFTEGYLRIYRDEGIVLEDSNTITAITKANPGVVTAGTHGYENGDEVYITGVGGMTEVNGKYFLVANKTSTTFELTDQDGNNVDTSSFTTYTSGGSVSRVFEVETPYLEEHLFQLKFAQEADIMYIMHPSYEPRKLTRTGHSAWTLSLYTRTDDPFLDKQTISGITKANPGVVTATAHTLSDGDEVIIEGVVGMTEVNGKVYVVANAGTNDFELTDLDGNNVNTSSYGTYTSGGYASKRNLLPAAVGLYEARLLAGGADATPALTDASKSPTDQGVVQYDVFTTGIDPDDGLVFRLAPQYGKIDKIFWYVGLPNLLAVGTFGGVSKITGSPSDEAIAPDSISIKSMVSEGCENVMPVVLSPLLIYLQRGGRTVRSLEFNALQDSYEAIDRNLIADHMTTSKLTQITFQQNRPEVLYGVREDGILIGLTFKAREDVSGWHRHATKGGEHKFKSVVGLPRANDLDQLWACVEREIDGVTRRYIEFQEDEPIIPERDYYFSGEGNEATDEATWLNAMFEAQKQAIHLDSVITYDGTTVGVDANAAITPGATTGTSITFTSNNAVFSSTDVGRQIWKKSVDGVGTGRAEIIEYTSSTEVVCNILSDFDSTDAMAAGLWYLTTDSVSGADHLEGENVDIITDGGTHDNEVVTSGAVSLDYQASMVHIGLGYRGILKTTEIEAGAATGPAQLKPRTINKVGVRFLNTLGAKYGTSLYRLQRLNFRTTADQNGRPAPLYSGAKAEIYRDVNERDKNMYIVQEKGLPCIVQQLELYVETLDE